MLLTVRVVHKMNFVFVRLSQCCRHRGPVRILNFQLRRFVLSESKVSHGLHLTEVARPPVNDTGVHPAAPRRQFHPGPASGGSVFGAGKHPNPVISPSLVSTHLTVYSVYLQRLCLTLPMRDEEIKKSVSVHVRYCSPRPEAPWLFRLSNVHFLYVWIAAVVELIGRYSEQFVGLSVVWVSMATDIVHEYICVPIIIEVRRYDRTDFRWYRILGGGNIPELPHPVRSFILHVKFVLPLLVSVGDVQQPVPVEVRHAYPPSVIILVLDFCLLSDVLERTVSQIFK